MTLLIDNGFLTHWISICKVTFLITARSFKGKRSRFSRYQTLSITKHRYRINVDVKNINDSPLSTNGYWGNRPEVL